MTQEEDNIVELVNALMSENKRLKERVRDLEGKLGDNFIIDDPIPDKDNESNSTECAQLDTKFAYIEGRLQGHDQVIAKVNERLNTIGKAFAEMTKILYELRKRCKRNAKASKRLCDSGYLNDNGFIGNSYASVATLCKCLGNLGYTTATTLGTSVDIEDDKEPEPETDKLKTENSCHGCHHDDTTLQDLFNIFFKE